MVPPRLRTVLCTFCVLLAFAIGAGLRAQEGPAEEAPDSENTPVEITEKEAELKRIQEDIRVLREARVRKAGEQHRLTTAVEVLEDRVRQARLELDYTTVSLEETGLRIRQTREELDSLAKKQERLREQLRTVFRMLAALERRSPLEALLLPGTFADFLGNQQALHRVHTHATSLLVAAQDLKRAREAKETDLRRRQEELEQLAKLQAAQRNSLQAHEDQQRRALSHTLAEAARLSSLLLEAEQARREIQQELFVLRNAGVRLSLKQAEEYARYAGSATGVRPALLLGVLKIESNVGGNVGSGRYPEDIHPDHREAFLRVMKKLGLDPATTPVSAKPTTYEGWGGAMGPGQILPGTWERIESDVARMTGKVQPSPFDLLDAFVGTAVILRNAGASSGSEFEAVNRYFAGPHWARFTWYGDRVLAVAKEYESR